MSNIKDILPNIVEDYDVLSLDGDSGFYDPKDYKQILSVLYPLNNKRIITDKQDISAGLKKQLLIDILESNDKDNNTFLQRLKYILPEGLCYKEICTDTEYEKLKMEFMI